MLPRLVLPGVRRDGCPLKSRPETRLSYSAALPLVHRSEKTVPELPEVETMRRGIAVISGSRIVEVSRPKCAYRPIAISPGIAQFRRRTRNRMIEQVGRIGKRVVLHLEGNERLVLEPRMTGLVIAADPPDHDHVRFAISLAGGPLSEVLFWDRRGLGLVYLLSDAEFAERFHEERIGPDALAISPEVLRKRLSATRTAIKVALLDQRRLAGVGNLYASEILHLARIHPARRADSLTSTEWQELHRSLTDVLETAVLYEGSTLSDGTYRNALNRAGGYQNLHRVYDRADAPCPRCRTATVVRIVQAQRSTFFCPTCQPKRASKSAASRPVASKSPRALPAVRPK